MNQRPAFEEIYMRFALLVAERATCRRTSSTGAPMKVGCVIVSTDFRYVYGLGYNGNAAGLPNTCDSNDVGACGCQHSESNAIVNCMAPRSALKYVFTSHLPCKNCGKMLIQLGGVEKVYYLNDYRLRDSLANFDVVGIKHEQFVLTPR